MALRANGSEKASSKGRIFAIISKLGEKSGNISKGREGKEKETEEWRRPFGAALFFTLH